MAKRQRRTFTEEQKRQAVDDFVSGRKTAAQVAADLAVGMTQIYKWKTSLEENAAQEGAESGSRPEDLKRIRDLEKQLNEYKLMLAEKTLIEELLKKRLRSTTSQQWNELTGLIETVERLGQKRGRVK